MEKKICIFEIQQALRSISLAYDRLPLINPDGIFGSKTKEAVRIFQNDEELLPTGEVDFKTWKRLMQAGKEAFLALSEPKKIIPIKNADLPLEQGDENNYVQVLQNMLNLALKSSDGYEVLETDGSFGKETFAATRLWQRICRIEESGIANKTTWNLLVDYHEVFGK